MARSGAFLDERKGENESMIMKEFLDELRSKLKEYSLVDLPLTAVKSALDSEERTVRHGPYLYQVSDPTTAKFPYVSMRLYSDSLEVRFTLGESVSPKRLPFFLKIGELVVYNPLSKGPSVDQKQALFYLNEVLSANEEAGKYFDLRGDGVYVKIARSRSPLESLIPDTLPAFLVYSIGTMDVLLDVAAKVGEVLIPLASLSIREGLRNNHVLEAWK
jgi:hypothetical protein